ARSASPAGASDPLWFAKCELQAERYIVCSVADQRVNEYLSKNASVHAGTAFGQFVADYFSAKGCNVGPINDGLRVNGIFYSWDTKALGLISCNGTPLRLTFQPDRMMISEFVSLYLSDRPRTEVAE
ncbi:MAG: hypothetical protein ABL893_14410, partial [Hyphomicrobium sp.]